MRRCSLTNRHCTYFPSLLVLSGTCHYTHRVARDTNDNTCKALPSLSNAGHLLINASGRSYYFATLLKSITFHRVHIVACHLSTVLSNNVRKGYRFGSCPPGSPAPRRLHFKLLPTSAALFELSVTLNARCPSRAPFCIGDPPTCRTSLLDAIVINDAVMERSAKNHVRPLSRYGSSNKSSDMGKSDSNVVTRGRGDLSVSFQHSTYITNSSNIQILKNVRKTVMKNHAGILLITPICHISQHYK